MSVSMYGQAWGWPLTNAADPGEGSGVRAIPLRPTRMADPERRLVLAATEIPVYVVAQDIGGRGDGCLGLPPAALTTPSSSTAALSHFWIRRIMRGSLYELDYRRTLAAASTMTL